jgi:5'-nucleotidase (lipoprotein e(P4) family)
MFFLFLWTSVLNTNQKQIYMKRFLILALIPLFFMGCQQKADKSYENLEQEHIVLATLWFQQSAEAKALYYQGFNIAKERVLEFKKEKGKLPQAVVVDLDETMIDNSLFQGKVIELDQGYTPDFWKEWTSKEMATALPGALDFSRFCDSLGVQIFYVSNRHVSELEATMNNLKELGFPFINPEYFILMENTSGKEDRRNSIAENYEIILLLGDNLNDFSDVFENRGDDWGVAVVDKFRKEFGRRFIVFPNPMYGEWEKNIYDHKRNLTAEQKFKLRREKVLSY